MHVIMPVGVSEPLLRQAVARSRSWRGVLRELGYSSPRVGRQLRAACNVLNIDYSHFRSTLADDNTLVHVVRTSSAWPELLGRLGYAKDSGSARATVRKHCARLGLDVSHLSAETAAEAVELVPRLDNLRDAGPYLVAAALTLAGHVVSWPSEGAIYDLLVDMRAAIRRVQVKTGTTRVDGAWMCSLKRGGDRRAYYSSEEIDLFACVDGDLRLYLIPVTVVEGLSCISLRKYDAYLVPTAPE